MPQVRAQSFDSTSVIPRKARAGERNVRSPSFSFSLSLSFSFWRTHSIGSGGDGGGGGGGYELWSIII